MSTAMRGEAARLPIFEGLVLPGRAGPARLSASGTQALALEHDGVQLQAYGRLRFADHKLNVLAQSEGMPTALLQAWRQQGEAMVQSLSGEYVLAVWEPASRRGLLCVDRFSSFPLYFGERDGRMAFAMRPARVCELLGMSAEVDARALLAYVWFHVIPAPLSIHRGVARLEGGQAVCIRDGHTAVSRPWEPPFEESNPFDFGTERDAFMAALRAGVAECIEGVGRDELGCFLSGGTDSSTIAGLATEAYGAPARTFSIGFDLSAYDESHYSRLAARHFGTEHTELILTPHEAERTIDVLARAYEQPFGNSSAVPTHVCARMAREAGVRRMLGGDGGDELYGGNERYATQWKFSLYGRVPSPLRRGVLEPLLLGPLRGVGWWPVRKARSYVEQAEVPLPDRLGARYNLLNRFGVSKVFTDAVLADAGAFEPLGMEREAWDRSAGSTQINRLLAYDFKFTLADNDLPKVTRMCHAAGAEVAFPMLTEALVAHSLRLAPGQKLRRTQLRYFFREALRGFLPDEIIDKSKHGFGMPFGEWLLAQPKLAHRADDALGSLADRGLVRASFLRELREAIRSQHAGYYGTMTWVLMMLELWLRENVDAPPQPDSSGNSGRTELVAGEVRA